MKLGNTKNRWSVLGPPIFCIDFCFVDLVCCWTIKCLVLFKEIGLKECPCLYHQCDGLRHLFLEVLFGKEGEHFFAEMFIDKAEESP